MTAMSALVDLALNPRPLTVKMRKALKSMEPRMVARKQVTRKQPVLVTGPQLDWQVHRTMVLGDVVPDWFNVSNGRDLLAVYRLDKHKLVLMSGKLPRTLDLRTVRGRMRKFGWL